MNLYPDLIPHKYFHKGVWLSEKNTPWYYFMKTNRPFVIPTNKSFYNTLDNTLKPIVKLLHSNNIPTTPSCSGHFKPKDHFSDTYDYLKMNQKKINNSGVILKDDENGKHYFYKNKNYVLPWSKEDFLDKIENYQKKGVIGLVDNNNIGYELADEDYDVFNDNGITLIITNSKTPKENQKIWNNIFVKLKNIL